MPRPGAAPVHVLAHHRAPPQLGQERAHLVPLGEALEHGDEAAVLLLRQLQVDDVVVQVVLAVAGRDREQLGTRGMHQHGPQRTDFGSDAYATHRLASAKLSVSSSSAMLTDFTATSAGTASRIGAKLRIALTPDWTDRKSVV